MKSLSKSTKIMFLFDLMVLFSSTYYWAKVIEIMKDSNLQNDISKQARNFIVQNYSWINIGKALDKVINEILEIKV